MGICGFLKEKEKVNGYIVNNSKKDIQYQVTREFQTKTQTKQTQDNQGPNVSANVGMTGGKPSYGLNSFSLPNQKEKVDENFKYTYKPSTHNVKPGCHS